MNLNSTKDFILLSNCISVQIRTLKSQNNLSENNDTLTEYTKILNIFKEKKSPQEAVKLLTNSENENCKQFLNYFLSSPADQIVKEHLDMVERLLINTNIYTQTELQEKLSELTKAFLKGGNENLNPYKKNNNTLKTNQELITKLNKLLDKKSSRQTSASDFIEISKDFEKLTLELNQNMFQQYFDTQEQKISNVEILQDIDENSNPIFKTTFHLNDKNSKSSTLTLQEPARDKINIMDDYQLLCYTYLEAKKYAESSVENLDSNTIYTKMNTFKECKTKLVNMQKNKINIAGGRAIFSAEANIDPKELDLKAQEDDLTL